MQSRAILSLNVIKMATPAGRPGVAVFFARRAGALRAVNHLRTMLSITALVEPESGSGAGNPSSGFSLQPDFQAE
jgi:hypothetical protein